ncbi:type IV secretion system DNA-binding domain-containing protein [Sphingomonas montanisoli]|uniref:Type IV secretion system DNA-binding domain-containing protein n=1 Tax=Sphingomonas montanisoli TaxID=2606412 RepID=A0A5D9C308_9SPHN|nr:type IV secretion system DNA-binding domain-containing protein [Sphingomonas montanisoli]TZG25662.1 type IV secretion system DNA-binding domain-containing protein [Sphingomonas montanisoli]
MTNTAGVSGGRAGSEPVVQQIAFLSAVAAIAACWPLVRDLVPENGRFALADLVREHWAHRHALEPWLEQRWAWLAVHGYHLWFALAALPGVIAAAIVQGADRRTFWPLVHAPIGWLGGSVLGYWLYTSFRADSWPLAVITPAAVSFLAGAIAARLAASPRKVTHLRGTRVAVFTGGRGGRLKARLVGGVTLAGLPLSREDETMHVAAIGATGSGKSTALRALMADAVRRGDRQVVADPDGAAMSAFFEPGDIILNPFDRRCARWDLLGEVERPGDYSFLAQSVLPHLGIGEHDQWISYAQQLLAAALENFGRLRLGTTRDLITMLASGSVAELKLLCQGTAAARYFEQGGEKMLASILGTLAPAVGNLRFIAELNGEPFSIRKWVRSGAGSLWLPYTANQVAALRGLISCWMNIAILETLSLPPDRDRRIWFHIDELDALGRIEGLKDAQARLRKFGGCVAIGFQSSAQVKAIYGEGAHTIIENCGNLLLLRAGLSEGGGTAELASALIGSRELERDETSRSHTRGRYTSRSSSTQSRRVVEDVTLASEIMQLSNRAGFVKKATVADWRRVQFSYVTYPERVAAFEPN